MVQGDQGHHFGTNQKRLYDFPLVNNTNFHPSLTVSNMSWINSQMFRVDRPVFNTVTRDEPLNSGSKNLLFFLPQDRSGFMLGQGGGGNCSLQTRALPPSNVLGRSGSFSNVACV